MGTQLFEASAMLVYKGETIVGSNGGMTKLNARKNLIKSLCNKLRSRVDSGALWVEWPDLSNEERDAWVSRVNEMVVWIEVDDNSSVLDATSFFDAVNRGVV